MPTTTYSLPSELLIEIFNYEKCFRQLVQYSLVCKRWNKLADSVILSRNITLYSEDAAWIFYHFLVSSPEKSKSVKYLTVDPPHCNLEPFRMILKLAFTPCMESFEGEIEGTRFFNELLLIAGEEIEYGRLRTIPASWNYSTTYDSLLHRFKSTLECIKLNFHESCRYNTKNLTMLYHLNQIENLTSLTLNSDVHDILKAENILKNCNQIKDLDINLSIGTNITNVEQFNVWIQEDVTRSNTLRSLKIRFSKDRQWHIVDYLVYKYPKIEKIVVERLPVVDSWIRSSIVLPMDIQTIKTVLEKISNVKIYQLECIVAARQ
ncbi:hypothetical protein INT46_002316, partial [Mucor plumbeus]